MRVPAIDVGRILAHQLDGLVEGGVVEPIDLVVLDGHSRVRATASDIDERAQDAVDERRRTLGHLGQVDVAPRAAAQGASLRTCLATDAAWSPIRSSSYVTWSSVSRIAQIARHRPLGRDRDRGDPARTARWASLIRRSSLMTSRASAASWPSSDRLAARIAVLDEVPIRRTASL